MEIVGAHEETQTDQIGTAKSRDAMGTGQRVDPRNQKPSGAAAAYTTIQTTVYRLERKQAVRRVRKISNAHIFEPLVAREEARSGMLDESRFFGGQPQPK